MSSGETNHVVMLTVVDGSVPDMAENLQETAIRNRGFVDRHAFVSIGRNRICRALREFGANCVQEFVDTETMSSSDVLAAGSDAQVYYHDIQVYYHDIQVYCHDIKVYYHDIQVYYHDIQVYYYDVQVYYHDIEVYYHDIHVYYHDI